MRFLLGATAVALALSGCGRLDHLGKPPSFSPTDTSRADLAMASTGLPQTLEKQRLVDRSSLWSASSNSLLGDPRASDRGDILTVVIEIDEKAEISNSTSRSRTADERMEVPELLGLPQQIDQIMPPGASMADAVELKSKSESEGDGSVRRKEVFGRSGLQGMHTWDDAFFWSVEDHGDDLRIADLAPIILKNY